MTCPVCGGKSTVVCCRRDVDTIIRRRKCIECKNVFYTEECETTQRAWQMIEYKYREQRKFK